MKIAIPTNDQKTVSAHFGRTAGFMIYNIEGTKIIGKEYRPNNFTGHAQGWHNDENHGEHQHSHSDIFRALAECTTVIAGGMGRRLYTDFEQQKIKVFVTQESNIEKAVELFIKNELDNEPDKCCEH